ncbi:MAG: hypothetical protein EXS15_06565 [Phycisphaerales bacterium]|nr:hypothetical protein [Phycisphaerales bacterium]
MPLKSLFIVASSLAIALSPAALSQGTPPATSTADAAPDANIQAALVNLTGELNALQSMNHAIGNARVNSEDRLNAMNAFIAAQNLTEAARDFVVATQSVPAGMSFADGYKTAVAQEKLRGLPQVTTTDLGALATNVSATTTLARESWDYQNKLFGRVAALSAFLQSKNLLVGYQQWAPNYAAKQRAANTARYAAANQKMNDDQAAYYQHLEALHEQWDKQPHGTGIDFNYAFSQGDGPDQGGTGESAPSGGVGDNPPNVVGVNTPWQYTGAGGGFYAGAYNQNGYYGGSTYNGYADSYNDLYGYPAGADMSAAGFTRAGVHKIWNRSGGNGNSPTPNGVGNGSNTGGRTGGTDSGAGGDAGGDASRGR